MSRLHSFCLLLLLFFSILASSIKPTTASDYDGLTYGELNDYDLGRKIQNKYSDFEFRYLIIMTYELSYSGEHIGYEDSLRNLVMDIDQPIVLLLLLQGNMNNYQRKNRLVSSNVGFSRSARIIHAYDYNNQFESVNGFSDNEVYFFDRNGILSLYYDNGPDTTEIKTYISNEQLIENYSPPETPVFESVVYNDPYIKLLWSSVADNKDGVIYILFRNDVKLTITRETGYIDQNVLKGVEYEYQLLAVDSDNNPSQELAYRKITIPVTSPGGSYNDGHSYDLTHSSDIVRFYFGIASSNYIKITFNQKRR